MRRITITFLTLIAAALLAVPPVAGAAKGPTPTISRVTPMRVSVGNLLTIRGAHFKAQRNKNTVVFRNGSGRTAFAKPRRASRTKLVVRVPASVARLLAVANSQQRPTRLKLRVLAGQFSKFTPRRLSPVVTGLGDGDGTPGGPGGGNGVCPDDDDLLPSSLEQSEAGTDPCLADTDKDGMSDGWEYWSAKDLNIKAVPYPGKRPFPNALDPSDGGIPGAKFSAYDFDGDGLTTLEEYRAWQITGRSVGDESVLGYSDGTQSSRTSDEGTYELRGAPGVWTDDERDADGDGLANFIESEGGPGQYRWWTSFWKQEAIAIDPWRKKSYCGQRPGMYDMRPYANVDLADPDVDGDTVLDGADDQDNDDWSNIAEMYEPYTDLDVNGNPDWCGKPSPMIPSVDRGGEAWAVNAYNPCAPDPTSRTCPPYIPSE